jgi:uncharacterized membrane-anchored protein
MSYIEKVEAELVKKLGSHEEIKSVVRWVSERILESYKNGIISGRKGGSSKRQPHDSSGAAE